MFQLLKRATLIFVLSSLAVLLFATLLPSNFEISREVIVQRPLQKVYASLSDLDQWSRWDPWQTREAGVSLKVVSRTPEQASAIWMRDGLQAGEVTLKTVVGKKQLNITIKSPGTPKRNLVVALQDLGGKVRVTWTVSGENGLYPLGNIFALQMEKYVGSNYEDALQKFKHHVESE